MTLQEPRLHNGQIGAALTARVVPGAESDGIIAVLKDGTLKIGLRAHDMPAINKAVIAYLSDILGVSTEKFEIVAGEEGVDKLISVLDIDAPTIQERIFSQIK